MKVLFDYGIFSIQTFGGVSRYFLELLRCLVKDPGLDIGLFMGLHINRYNIDALRRELDYCLAFRYPRLPGAAKLALILNRAAFSMVKHRQNPDLVHQTYYFPAENEGRYRRVVTVHDMIYELFPAMFSTKDKTPQYKKRAVLNADGVIAVSEKTKSDLVRCYGIDPEIVRVIPHANSLTAPGGHEPLIKAPYILYVGERYEYKNFHTLLAVYSRERRINENFRLVCFGGKPFNKDELAVARNGSVEERMTQLSGSDETLANLYKFAQAFVYPSTYEGFGLPLLEAMHYGCPVAASNAGSIPEVAGPACRYFSPDSEEELTGALMELIDNSDLRKELIAAGTERASKFSWENTAIQTSAYYSHVLGAQRS